MVLYKKNEFIKNLKTVKIKEKTRNTIYKNTKTN